MTLAVLVALEYTLCIRFYINKRSIAILEIEELKKEEIQSRSKRPNVLTLFAPLAILSGVIALALAIFMGSMGEVMEEVSIPASYIQLSIAFLGVLALASGIGMWTGKKWGWWLAAFYFLYAVARNLNALLLIPQLIADLGSDADPTQYYPKHIGRAFINSLFFLYFFTKDVTNYFGFNEKNMSGWWRFGIMVAVIVGIFVISSLLAGSFA